MPAYWLFKSEPGTFSWGDQIKAGRKGEPWDGVRNHQAAANMKAMEVGDLGFFYHSVNEKRIVGIVEVIKGYAPDPTDESGKFGLVTVRAVEAMPQPVTLTDIKADAGLADLPLVRQARLSVMPIPAEAWSQICAMGGLKGR